MDGKSYNWCEGNGAHAPAWVLHKREACSGFKRVAEDGASEEDGATTPTDLSIKKTVRWSTAIMATITDSESDG